MSNSVCEKYFKIVKSHVQKLVSGRIQVVCQLQVVSLWESFEKLLRKQSFIFPAEPQLQQCTQQILFSECNTW